jgi:tRNA modification GTPase
VIRPRTIFALSSGPPPAGVAVVRLSGPDAGSLLEKIAGKLPAPRMATRVRLRDISTKFDTGGADTDIIDDALVLWFPAPNSFTGEDVVEFHLHGGRAVIAALSDMLSAQADVGMAEPGEFTRRAFENGKLDLTQAEGIGDLVHAETEAQRRQALRQTDGALGDLYENWRLGLLRSLAWLEADIDFSDDEDLPDNLVDQVRPELARVRAAIQEHLADNHRGERLREGIYVAILGPPNAGKSSLFNKLAKRDAAIVSEIAGTTRDVIEVHLDLGGYPVVVADTAGLRRTADEIEDEGVRRALQRAEQADLKIIVLDGADAAEPDPATLRLIDEDSFVVLNKSDKGAARESLAGLGHKTHAISVKTGEGVKQLLEDLGAEVSQRFGLQAAPGLTRTRHREALEGCRASLDRFFENKSGMPPELAAEDIRLAARALGVITGRVDVESLLDVVFRDFCIGK